MNISDIDRIIDKQGCEASLLIQIMLEIQSVYKWLPQSALERVSERLQVPLSQIRHIATFYKAFSMVPKGQHAIHVCMGTACHVRGAQRILESVQDQTGIKPGETDIELKFSLEIVNCLGCCALGPVLEVDGKIHGNISTSKSTEVINNL